MSFSHFVTPTIINVVYLAAMALCSLESLLLALSTFSISLALGAALLVP